MLYPCQRSTIVDKEKVFNELKLEIINADDGLNKLITYLDKLFKKDELCEV